MARPRKIAYKLIMTEQENNLVEWFIENAERVGARVTTVKDDDEPAEAVRDFIGAAESVYCPRKTEIEKRLALNEAIITDDYRGAAVCVEECDAAIAETGSVVLLSGPNRSLAAGLLPEHHIVLIPKSKIYTHFEEFLSDVSPGPANIVFETGPSRTADIELTLTEGVHGPEKLSIVVLMN
jgi:L-lactate dehydrogenase complex protein LldG